MIDKRFWSGAIAIVTLIVAGAGALPELLLRPPSTKPTVVLPVRRADPVAPPARTSEAAPQPVAADPEPPIPAPEASAAAPATPATFPPVQPVGVAAARVQDVVPPAPPQAARETSQAAPANPPRPNTEKPAQSERSAQRPAKPRQNVRPALYPMAEFLAWRR